MKTIFNLTTSPDDLNRFANQGELLSMLDGFDGLELMCFEDDVGGIIPRERVIGLHMSSFPYWLDFWNGDEAGLLKEFGSLSQCQRYYGGSDKNALLCRFRQDLVNAQRYGAEYVVFHVSNASIEETFTRQYCHSDEEVISATCELLNDLFPDKDGPLLLLLENLWHPGLTLTKPEATRSLLKGVHYKNTGIMLDTGHLLHMNTALRSQKEGLAYIHSMLDAHGDLCGNIRGIHLNQSLTGQYSENMMKAPPVLKASYAERSCQAFLHAFAVDKHLPFTCEGVSDLIKRIAPQYLTFEFITSNNAQHREYLKAQKVALQGMRDCLRSAYDKGAC